MAGTLEDRTVVVTGAGGGIADSFVAEGAQVLMAERDRRAGSEAARQLGDRARDLGD